jgi:peptidyl-prolyl cis-trans isomerase A (cyclophilin A)
MIPKRALLVAAAALAACSERAEPPAASPAPAPATSAPTSSAEPLRDPRHPEMNRPAPSEFRVRVETSRGPFTVLVVRAWAPRGADRFYNLVRHAFYDEARFFRVVPGFVAQFGIHGDPAVSAAWREAAIADDPPQQSNVRGTVVFATAGPNTRTTQVFVNFRDNTRLDRMGFAPFGKVIEGMEVVDALYSGYGEGPPQGIGPRQDLIQKEGNAYLRREFPELDFIKSARVAP